MATGHGGVRMTLVSVILAALAATGCGVVQSQALLATLPASAGGVNFDTSRVIDDSHSSGHPVDDVLAALGKRRSHATIVERFSRVGEGDIGAMVVDGVPGDVLLETVVQTCDAPAVVARTQTTISGRDVWTLDIRPGHVFLAYRRGPTLYWASTNDHARAEQFVAAMP
jgi:hypothetical protein